MDQDNLGSPALSADSRNIYFTKNSSIRNENGIYAVKANGSDFKAIYKDNESQSRKFYQLVSAGNDEYVIFSHLIERDGRKVIELYKMCPCGQRVVRLTNFETANGAPISTEAFAGSFSLNSEYLYFSQSYSPNATSKDINIYRMRIATGEMTLLKTVKGTSTVSAVPSISADGERILFSLDNNIQIMNSDGSNLTSLSILKGYRPQWEADNKTIFYSSENIPGITSGIYKTDNTAALPQLVSRNSALGMFGGFALNK